MLTNALSKTTMAQDSWFLKEDGCLNVHTEASFIIHHPNLNVILVCTKDGKVTVIDVNSGDILQSTSISEETNSNVGGRYLPGIDKIIFWNDLGIGLRSDYNGVLLLPTILQIPTSDAKKNVKLELLLSEAVLLRQSLKGLILPSNGQWADFASMLDQKINIAKSSPKKGIKVQKWNIVELNMQLGALQSLLSLLHSDMITSEQCTPGMAIVASMHERLLTLSHGTLSAWSTNSGSTNASTPTETALMEQACVSVSGQQNEDPDRENMFSEAARRKTFNKWPHMDYKWALPDQMAQAGFYYKPTSVGDDRAMCFTCSVCLVCWDRTDEPWSEHERHSPGCPFVKGEYTQNVPIAVTYATGTAGIYPGVQSVSAGDHSEIICTSKLDDEVTIWSVNRDLEKQFSFHVTPDILDLEDSSNAQISVTALAVLLPFKDEKNLKSALISASSTSVTKSQYKDSTQIICGTSVQDSCYLVRYEYITTSSNEASNGGASSPATGGGGGARKANSTSIDNIKDEVVVMYVDDNGHIPHQLGLKKKKKKSKDKQAILTAFHFPNDSDHQSPELFGIPENPDDDNAVEQISYEYFVNSPMYEKNQTSSSVSKYHDDSNSNMIHPSNILAKLLFKNDLHPDGLEALISKYMKVKGEKPETTSVTIHTSSKPLVVNYENSDSCLSYQSDATDFSTLNGYGVATKTQHENEATSSKNAGQSENISGIVPNEELTNLKQTSPFYRSVKFLSFYKIPHMKNCKITNILPSRDGKFLVVIMQSKSKITNEQMEVDDESGTLSCQASVLSLGENSSPAFDIICVRKFTENETPIEIKVIPARRRFSGLLLITSVDGAVRLLDVQTLCTIASSSLDDGQYVSADYCSGLSRICACTNQGLLRFYGLEGEDLDEDEEEDLELASNSVVAIDDTDLIQEAKVSEFFKYEQSEIGPDHAVKNALKIIEVCDGVESKQKEKAQNKTTSSSNISNSNSKEELLANKKNLMVSDLRNLHKLSLFDEACFPYSATVPACWCRLVQAQKQRRQPHRARSEDGQHAYAWRLQNDATTWDEHIFEVTLPYSCNLGHIDFKFVLHSPCGVAPNLQITLLKQISGIGHLGKSGLSDNIDTTTGSNLISPAEDDDSNPVLTSEYLRAQHAELLAGPVHLVSGLDLSGQGGVVTLTSPALFKYKSRTLLIHVKTMFHPVQQDQEILTREGVNLFGNASGSSQRSSNEANNCCGKAQNYLGCDWLHEVSISVRCSKSATIPHARLQRASMLDSDMLLQQLLHIATMISNQRIDGVIKPANTRLVRNMALDTIGWLINVRMTRNRLPDASKRQADCAKIVQAALEGLINVSLLSCGRSEARKCVKILLVCSNGVSDLPSDAPSVPFNQSLLRVLLRSMLNGLPRVKTASALRWYCLLLIRFAAAENRGALAVVERCLRLLRKAAVERNKRRCPYTDLLRSRFSLNGSPFDSDIFDGELPYHIRQRSIDSMLGSRKPKAISELADMTAKPVPCTKGLRGLGEVQPLHFICHSASEGTKLEKLQSSAASSCCNFDITHSILCKHFDCPKDIINEDILESTALNMNCKLGKLLLSVEKELAKAKSTLGHKDIDMEVSDCQPDVEIIEDMSVDADDTKSNTFSQYFHQISQLDTTQSWSPASQATTIGSQNTDFSQNGDEYILPWSRILTLPTQQAIVIARMHSCARRFVILDFGRPILLTDLAIPSCSELMSLALDYWITNEDGESTRLVLASDIGTRTLVMKDLQPAPILRYLKLTMIGRYGMTATSVKLSAGRFYGHSTVLEADAYCDSPGLPIASAVTSAERARAQLSSLNSLYEDTACRYRSACCNLRYMLKPLMGLAPSLAEKCAGGEDDKILQVYQECISLQQQLNVLQSVTSRLQEACEEQNAEQQVLKSENYVPASTSNEADLTSASSDKLRVLFESLVVVYLRLLQKATPKMANNMARFIDQEACSELFSTLVVHGDSAQISCCALLSTACSSRVWWGTFLADSLKILYSSSCTQLFPKERVFLLLTHLGRRGNPRSRVLDAALLALLQLLAPIAPVNETNASGSNKQQQLDEDELSPLSAKIDLSLLSWLLLYLSACLDDGRDINSSRWEFMSGQMSMQRTRSESDRNHERSGATRVYRRKLQKRLLHHKIQLDDLESAKKVFQSSSQASNLSAKLDAALKQQESVFKKTLKLHSHKYPFKVPSHQQPTIEIGETVNNNNNISSSAGGSSSVAPGVQTDNTITSSEAPVPPLDMSPPDPLHCLAVCRALLALLLRFDSTCGADTFLLICKVLAKLVTSCRPTITLGQIASSQQLLILIRRSVWTDGRRVQWAGPWAQHAATCLLQDLVETETKKDTISDQTSGKSDGGTLSAEFNAKFAAGHSAPLSSLDIMSIDEPEDEANGPLSGKNQLPSLMESDDSELEEFLDDVMDRTNVPIKCNDISYRNYTIPSSSVSIALDARLESGLDSSGELMLRRMKLSALTRPVTPSTPSSPSANVCDSPISTGTPNSLSPEDHAHLMNWIVWPDIYSDPVPTAPNLLSPCFDALFANLHMQTGANLEALLRLWTALNDQARCKIILNSDSLHKLISALAWLDAIPLRAWSLGFQCLSAGVLSSNELGCQIIPKGAAAALLDEPDFRAMLVRFLSGDGDSTCQAGPTACQAMYKCLLRLKSRCEDDSHFRNAMLRVLLRLLRPGQPVALQQGPQDAQARFVHGLLHAGYERCDLVTAMTVIESIGTLVAAHTARCERVRCRSVSESSTTCAPLNSVGFTSNSCFGSLFASVLDTGSTSNSPSQQSGSKVKNDNTNNNAHGASKNANTEALLVALLRLANRLVCMPLHSPTCPDSAQQDLHVVNELMDTSEEQTDERKAERLSSTPRISSMGSITSSPTPPQLADTVLRHNPTTARLLRSLCSRGSGLVRPHIINIQSPNSSPSHPFDGKNIEPEPRGVADALYVLLDTMVKVASDQSLVAKPLYDFIFDCVHGSGNSPRLRLTVPLLTLFQRALTSSEAVQCFANLGGIIVVCEGLVKCQRGLVSERPGRVSRVMMCLGRRDAENAKGEECLENLATLARISPMNGAAQAADALLQPAHRRARTPAWTYHFYREEAHAELLITLPAAALLREVHVQPHLTTLATCPSAIAIEISPDKKTPLTPVCPPMACAGMTLIRLQLPTPEVASRVLIRLYRPRDNPNIGLTQIKLLGCSVFNETGNCGYGVDSANEEYGYGCSSGWLSLLEQCLGVEDPVQLNNYITQSASVPGLLRACCTLLVAPSTCHKLANNLLLKLTLKEYSLGLKIINILLKDGSEIDHACIDPTAAGGVADHVAELLGALCSTHPFKNNSTITEEQAFAAKERAAAALQWLQQAGEAAVGRNSGKLPCACCVYELATILWAEQAPDLPYKELYSTLTTRNLLLTVHRWTLLLPAHSSLKQALDAILCAACRLRPDLLHVLLCDSGAARKDPNAASVTDDSKDRLTIDSQKKMGSDYESDDELSDYTPLAAQDSSELILDDGQLETLSLVCQSKAGVKMLFDSGLLRILSETILVFINQYKTKEQLSSLTDSDKASSINSAPMATANGVAAILNFFAELCAEKDISDWLGSAEGSAFWNPLLMLLCCNSEQLNSVQSSILEAACVTFLSRVIACSAVNQKTLSTVMCQIISAQSAPSRESPYAGGVSGFTRRLVLQLLLRSERIFVAIQCDENIFPKPGPATAPTLCMHPALRPRAGVQMLILPAHTKLQDLSSYFGSLVCSNVSVPSGPVRDSRKELWECSLKSSDHSSTRDKRSKEAKNYANRNSKRSCTNDYTTESKKQDPGLCIWHPLLPKPLPGNATVSQLLNGLKSRSIPASNCQSAILDIKITAAPVNKLLEEEQWLLEMPNLVSPIEIFSSLAGLSLLAQRLPVVPVMTSKSFSTDAPVSAQADKICTDTQDWMDLAEWVKVEAGEEVYCDDMVTTAPKESFSDEVLACSTPPAATQASTTASSKKSSATSGAVSMQQMAAASGSVIPAHALAAFALFLRLPGYAEVLLRDRLPAQCLLRLMLGVADDGEGNDIFSLPVAVVLPTLPFCVLRRLLDITPLTTDDGLLLRLNFVDVGALHLVLGCLAVFTHHTSQESCNDPPGESLNNCTPTTSQPQPSDKGLYWAKGTGFGTGSTQQSWNVEQALARQKGEELHVTSLLQALSAFINPGDQKSTAEVPVLIPDAAELMPLLKDSLKRSCLLPAISSYLRNDSVLDMARHVPLYLAVLQLLRAFAQSNQLAMLLIPTINTEDATPISCLLSTMKQCVDTYAMRLQSNSKVTNKNQSQKLHSAPLHTMQLDEDDEDDEGLATLIPEIQETALLVEAAVERLKTEEQSDNVTHSENVSGIPTETPTALSLEQRYLQTMKKLQFDTYEMMAEISGLNSGSSNFRFTVPYHYENSVRAMGFRCCHPGRVKRLAQEAVTLSTSLPLSFSSSVFVRCDTDRLDVMKVLITGPAETPYANGCFEFDVFFPPDYPASPMQVHLETTGRQSVRFNPNLYNDGKVCLSVLNTWHGRPEEKWNSQTSSFLQVLVSIQSLILVPEPYFNEPGYERCRGTPSGANSSREYNANIYQACVRWGMLEQLKQPCACFKEVIQTHFWMKRHEIVMQVEGWIAELESQSTERRTGRVASLNAVPLKRYYKLLREELSKLPVPEGMSELDQPPFSADTSPTTPTASQFRQLLDTLSSKEQTTDPWSSSGVAYHSSLSSQPDIIQDALTTETTDTDVEMEKIVSDVLCE